MNKIRVPEQLLEPLIIPGFVSYPVTVEGVLIQVAVLESLVDKANDRFTAIKQIQMEGAE